MKSLNEVRLIGHVGSFVQRSHTAGGDAVASISLATNWTSGTTVNTDWHKVVAFGKTAEIILTYCKVGMRLFVGGRLKTSSYDKNGVITRDVCVVASNIIFLSKDEGDGGNEGNEGNGEVASSDVRREVFEDEIPF